MAKAPSPPPAAEPPPAAARKGGKKLLIVLLAAIVLVLLVAALLIGVLLMKKGTGDEADIDGERTASSVVDLSRPPTFVPLEPFVVNLAPAEGDRYLQAVLALRVSDAKTAEHLKGFMPMIRDEINKVLSSKLPSELATLEGREELAAELARRVNAVLGGTNARNGERRSGSGPVQAVLFNSFIVQ